MSASVPPSDRQIDGGRPRRWRWWHLVPLLVFAAVGIGAVTVRIPYFVIAPGEALEVSGLVEVQDGPTFDPAGEIYLTTVRLRHATVVEAVSGWLDPAVDVVEQEVVVPPQVPADELTDFNLQLMDVSKQTAFGVALEQLGVDAVTGQGATVVSVLDGTPAEGVLEPGDVITAVDGESVDLHYEVVRAIGEREPGDAVALTYRPAEGEGAEEVEVELGRAPGAVPHEDPTSSGTPAPTTPDDEEARPLLGVTLQTADLEFDFPFDVEIASDRIGGPSAGLAFTLQVLDVLTEGELTGGRRVAATGTIELDGSVGAVGGVAQKTVAVQREGIELFLVPALGEEAARRVADDDLEVVAVETLDDALEALRRFGGESLRPPTEGLLPT